MKPATVTRNFAKFLWAAVLAVACTREEPITSQAPKESGPAVSVAAAPAVATVQLGDELLGRIEDPSVQESLGITGARRVFPDAGEFEARSRAMGLHRFYKVTFPEKVPVTRAVADLSSVPGVLSVTPQRPIRKRGFFNDPYLARQWNLYNTYNPSADIHVQEVWERYTTGSNQVIVSIVDECVDATHPDLQGNLWKDSAGHTGYNFARDSYDLSINARYDTGHGTHVAGVVAAVNNNGLGVSSMAGGDAAAGVPGVLLQSCAIYSGSQVADDAQTAQAIKWAADHGALISQNSWGYDADANGDGTVTAKELADYKATTIPEVIKAAVDYFITYAGCDSEGRQREDSPMKGGLVVFAVGNEGDMGVDYDPVCTYDPIISVGAFGMNGQRAFYSSYGNWVDVAAPGGGATSKSDIIWSTVPGSLSSVGYEGIAESTGYLWVGCSMACPHVSGALALITSYFGGKGFTAGKARDILFGGLGSTIGGSKPVGKKLDVLAAFEYGKAHYPVGGGGTDPLPPVVSLSQTQLTLRAHEETTIKVSAIDPQGLDMRYQLEPGSSAVTFNESAHALTVCGWKANPGTYRAVLTVTDEDHLSTSVTLEYTLMPNHAPRLGTALENMVISGLQRQGTAWLDLAFLDDDGETLAFKATSSNESCARVALTEDLLTVNPVGYGLSQIEVTATDFFGKSVSAGFKVAVIDPDVPVMVSPAVVSTQATVMISATETTEVSLKLFNPAGALLQQQSHRASVFDPIVLDTQNLAPGRYALQVAYGGEVYKVALVKY